MLAQTVSVQDTRGTIVFSVFSVSVFVFPTIFFVSAPSVAVTIDDEWPW